MPKHFTSGLVTPDCAYVWALDGAIFCILDDKGAEEPRSPETLARHAALIAASLNAMLDNSRKL